MSDKPFSFICDEERSRLAGEAANAARYRVKTSNGYMPRRVIFEHLTPLEKQVKKAMLEIDRSGAHRLLTDAVVLLELAGRALADWTDLGEPGLASVGRNPEGEDREDGLRRNDEHAVPEGQTPEPSSRSPDNG